MFVPETKRFRRLISAFPIVAVLVFSACSSSSTGLRPSEVTADISDPTVQVARSNLGMVSSASKMATSVGARVLAEGGNAVDAAAATAFALAVTEPTMSGLGGRTSIVVRTASGNYSGYDGLNQVPSTFVAGAPAGYATAAIPGVPAALVAMVERFGSWPLERIVAPAIQLAEQGFQLSSLEASRIAGAADELRAFPASRRYFLKGDGTPYATGERLVQLDLARTLRSIASDGARGFYQGWVADSVHADMVAQGGFITRSELQSYRALPAIQVKGTYRGYRLTSNFSPAAGHTVVQALQMMERFDIASLGSAERAFVVGQAMQIALSDRNARFGTPEETAVRLSSKAHAAERGSAIVPPGGELPQESEEPVWWLRPDQDNTTHLSVVDAGGMAVALTQSLGPLLGTKLAASGAGFLYATRLGSVPGSRPGSTIAPTIVTDPDGKLRYVLGAAGDARIITAVIQTLSRAIDQGYSLDRAVAAPRVHPTGARALMVEKDSAITWSDAELARFESLGMTVTTSPSTYFARVHAVAVDPASGSLLGVAEPRGAGGTSGPIRR